MTDPDLSALTPARLQRVLDGRWGWVRDEVRNQLREPLFRPVVAMPMEEHRARTLEQALATAGTSGPRLLFPKQYGGLDELGAAITAFEMLGFGDLSLLVKNGVQFGLFGGALLHLGTERHHKRYLPDAITMALPGCFAMTETGHGSDVQSVRTTATYDAVRQEFVVHTPDERARKDYIGNAARDGRVAVVFAQLVIGDDCHGVHAFVVPIRDDRGEPVSGVSIEDCGPKAGLNGVDNGRLSFDQVRVPREALLDRYGAVAADGTYSSPIEGVNARFFTMLGTLVQGRVSISGAAVSATKTALTIAVRYALRRTQFRPPDSGDEVLLLDYRQHQRRLLPALASTYALHFAQEALVAELHRIRTSEVDEREQRELEGFAAGLKATTTWHATATIQACREACGGVGYLAENRLPQLKADTDIFTTFEGDNTVLLQLVAKGLLTDYRDEFGALDLLGTVRFVTDQVVETLIERTAARRVLLSLADALPGSGDDGNLLDRGFHLELLSWREKHILSGVARRLQKGMSAGGDAFTAFNDAQDHVLLAAKAHVDRVVLETFAAAIERCEDPDVAALLGRVCDLHVLALLERERGWFLEHGRLTPARAKGVTAAVNDLCRWLRPHAGLLVDAFGIPEEVLAAPIATRQVATG